MWSRTGQRQSLCLCRACIQSPKTVARRSTTAATRRRKVTATDLFTACYTTILGTAAIIDAQNKEFRKQDLDDKLEKARAAVNKLTAQNAAALAESATASTYSRHDSSDISSHFLARIQGRTLAQQCSSIYGTQWKVLPPTLSEPQVDWAGIEKAIVVEGNDSRIKLIEPISEDQLQHVTTTVIELVEDLVAKVDIPRHDNQQGRPCPSELSSDGLECQVWRDLEIARYSSKYPSYDLPHSNPDTVADTRSNLRAALVAALEGTSTSREMVGRICYNLLVSTAPPSIMIYNTLIAGFNRLERPDLAQSVVETVLKDTAGPDTQQTTLCLLNHFRCIHDAHGIRRVAQRMRGGSATTRHLVQLPEPRPARKTFDGWLHDQVAVQEQAAIYLKTSPITSLSYDTLIRAWLEAGNMDRAAKKFVECIRHDVRTDCQTILLLLQGCAGALDSKAARKLLKGIAKHTRNFFAIIQQLIFDAPIATSVAVFDNLYRLLDISWDTTICEYGQNMERFVDFTARLKPWVYAQRLQLQCRQAISEVDGVFDVFSLDWPLLDRAEAALEIISQAGPLSQDDTIWQRAVKLSAVQSHFDHLSSKTMQLSSQIQNRIIKYKTGVNFDPFEDLESIRNQERYRQLVLADALEQVQLRDKMTQGQVKQDLVIGLPDKRQATAFQQANIADRTSVGNLVRFYGPKQRQLVAAMSQDQEASIIGTFESEVNDRLRSARALLYSALCPKRHRLLRWSYQNWDDIPLELLVELNLRRLPKTRGIAPGRASTQTNATEPKLRPGPSPKALPASVEISPIGPHIRRRWNPPQRKSWLPVQSTGLSEVQGVIRIDPSHQSASSTQIDSKHEWGRLSATA